VGDLGGLPDALLGELAGAKLIHQTTALDAGAPDVARPVRDLASLAPDRLRIRDGLDLVEAWAGLAPAFHHRPFSEVLARVRARPRGETRPQRQALVEARAAVFNALLPWSPIQGACLLQSAWLIEFLGQANLSADWVFGVRTWPFSAHCWVQAGDVVLNDTVERVAPYRVILKV
jgi:hypothetical protein